MSEPLWLVRNSARPTTASWVKQPTGTAIRTMLQIAVPSTHQYSLVEWGCSFDASAAAAPGQVELFTTTVAATMSTAHVSADFTLYGRPSGLAIPAGSVGSTVLSGFATAAVTEGTVANYNEVDGQLIAPTTQYVKQFPSGARPVLGASTFLRCRVTYAATVNMSVYVVLGLA